MAKNKCDICGCKLGPLSFHANHYHGRVCGQCIVERNYSVLRRDSAPGEDDACQTAATGRNAA